MTSRIPLGLLRAVGFEILASALVLRLVFRPSMPVAVALVALAGAWALEKILVSHTRAYQKSLIKARAEARSAAESASRVDAGLAAFENRITRLENKEGFRRS